MKALFAALPQAAADRVLEHSLIYAVIRIAHRDATIPYLRDANPQVRRAALIALDQMEGGHLTRDLVVPLLDTDDPALQKQALEIIAQRDGWAGELLALLKTWLDEPRLTDGRAAMLRGVLLAQAGDGEIQRLVADSLGRADLSPAMRLLLLEVIQRAAVDPLPAQWVSRLEGILQSGQPESRLQAVRIVQARNLVLFDRQLDALTVDESQPAELRVEALIARGSRMKSLSGELFTFLIEQLNEDVPPLDRLAAARALADAPLSDVQLADLAGRFDAAGPLAVPSLLRAFGRTHSEAVGRTLVAELERSAVSVPAEELAGLLRAYPESVQSAAAGLLKRLGVDSESQRARLDELSPLLETGDPRRGRDIFFGRKAACSGCHAVSGEGGKVGPDLTKIGAIRTGRDLLEAIVFPSASFAREYRTYLVLTDDGRLHTGVIGRQTADSIYLRTAELSEVRIPRATIEELRESPVSLMPAGLDRTLSEEEFRDLLAYLRELK